MAEKIQNGRFIAIFRILRQYTFLNNNTPHSEQRRTVLIRKTVHAKTRASSL